MLGSNRMIIGEDGIDLTKVFLFLHSESRFLVLNNMLGAFLPLFLSITIAIEKDIDGPYFIPLLLYFGITVIWTISTQSSRWSKDYFPY